MTDGELGDFEDYGDAPDASTDPDDGNGQEQEQNYDHDLSEAGVPNGEGESPGEAADRLREEHAAETQDLRDELEQVRPLGPDNPLGLDPRVGVKDLCFDRAKPGAKVYVVASLASTVEEYERAFPDAPALDEYAGNVVTEFSRGDAVLACVYVKDSLTSVDTNITAYPMPESRLTRYPAEEASLVGGSSMEFARTHVPGTPPGANVATGVTPDGDEPTGDESKEGEEYITIPCGCGEFTVKSPDGTVDIDVICPECGNHFGQGTANVIESKDHRLAGAEPRTQPDGEDE